MYHIHNSYPYHFLFASHKTSLISRPSYAPSLVKKVTHPCPNTANHVGQIRLQNRGHMAALECN